MPDIPITVQSKVARIAGSPEIVCGNSDYTVEFEFDGEWSGFRTKTAHFVWFDRAAGKKQYAETVFDGSRAVIPAIYNADMLLIGVYAGNIRTTTPARVPCVGCITDGAPLHPDPEPDIYEQLLELLRDGGQGSAVCVCGALAGDVIDAATAVSCHDFEEVENGN